MRKKQVFKVKNTVNERIVKIASSHSSYVDDHFFQEHMDECKGGKDNHGYKDYSVVVQAIQASWLLKPEGYEFLLAIIDKDDVNIFKINSIEMIVEFLF